MKTKKNLFRPFSAAAFATVAFAMSSIAHAQSWDGGGADASWGTAANWDPADTLPTFGTTADLSFPTDVGLTSGTTTFLGVGRQVRSLTFGADVDTAFAVSFSNSLVGVSDTRLTFANATANSINVLAGSTGAINIGNPLGLALAAPPASTFQISGPLTVDHNGSGLLTFSRPISTVAALSFTKTGTGTLQTNNNNLITGVLNVNGGRLIANSFTTAGDFNAVSSINLGGGTLQYNVTSSGSKTVSPALNVTTASVLAYNNTDTGVNRSLNFPGPNAFTLGADLTVQNISAGISFQNVVNISRNVSGAGALNVDSYNDINSSTTNFSLGRVALGGTNGSWSGALNINKGIAEIYGTAANMDDFTGAINIGTTGDAFGAGLLFSPNANANITFTNPITVRSGGFRTIRSGIGTFGTGSDTFYTFNNSVTLNGNLNLHIDAINTDRRFTISGPISGAGGLQLTKGNNGFFLLSGDNSGWSGGLTVAQGTAQIRGNAVNSLGTGPVTIGAEAGTTAAVLTFAPQGPNGSTVSYTNNITATPGGDRTISGGGTDHNITLATAGTVTLNGDLTVNHSFSAADRRINLNGQITGAEGLTITRSGGSTATTVRMAGANNYLGDTTVAATASLAFANTGSVTTNVVVQTGGARIGGPGTIGGNLTLEGTAKFFFFYSGSYTQMNVNGAVTVPNSFGVASIVGGSQGEVVPWNTIPAGTYTLIGTTASTFNTGDPTNNNITNFGVANAATGLTGGRTAHFQNGGGGLGGGLQIVINSGYAAWQVANGNTAGALDDDHDNDGVDNGTEFFLSGSTNSTGFTPLPGVVDTSGVLSVTWVKGATYAGAYTTDFVVEISDTLDTGSWTPAPLGVGAGNVEIIGSSVKYTFPTGTKKFARLKVTGP